MSGWGKATKQQDDEPQQVINQREKGIRERLDAARRWARSGDADVVSFNPKHFAMWEDVAYLLDLITELRAIIRVRSRE